MNTHIFYYFNKRCAWFGLPVEEKKKKMMMITSCISSDIIENSNVFENQ